MSKKLLRFGDAVVSEREFHASKKPIALDLVDIDKIVTSDKFTHSDEGSQYLIGYKYDAIIRPLCIVLPQMSGYIKYVYNGGKNMSFLIDDYSALVKYNSTIMT